MRCRRGGSTTKRRKERLTNSPIALGGGGTEEKTRGGQRGEDVSIGGSAGNESGFQGEKKGSWKRIVRKGWTHKMIK